MIRDDIPREIRQALTDPIRICESLGLGKGMRRQMGGGALVCCPIHNEKSPSCSVTRGKDGTIRFKCFGCEETGDVLHLVAAANGLNLGSHFREVLLAAAHLGGLHGIVTEIETGKEDPNRPVEAPRRPVGASSSPERPYPPSHEVNGLWKAGKRVSEDTEASGALVSRLIDPEAVDYHNIACVLPDSYPLPSWASYQRRTWEETGHRLLIPVCDSQGILRSIRAWRVRDGDTPKRLPPAGYRAAALVLANPIGAALLRGDRICSRAVMVEGEPDFLIRSVVNPGDAVFGVLSGSWSASFAERIPYGFEVIVRTHRDQAGERYAQQIIESLRDRAQVFRLQLDEVTQ